MKFNLLKTKRNVAHDDTVAAPALPDDLPCEEKKQPIGRLSMKLLRYIFLVYAKDDGEPHILSMVSKRWWEIMDASPSIYGYLSLCPPRPNMDLHRFIKGIQEQIKRSGHKKLFVKIADVTPDLPPKDLCHILHEVESSSNRWYSLYINLTTKFCERSAQELTSTPSFGFDFRRLGLLSVFQHYSLEADPISNGLYEALKRSPAGVTDRPYAGQIRNLCCDEKAFRSIGTSLENLTSLEFVDRYPLTFGPVLALASTWATYHTLSRLTLLTLIPSPPSIAALQAMPALTALRVDEVVTWETDEVFCLPNLKELYIRFAGSLMCLGYFKLESLERLTLDKVDRLERTSSHTPPLQLDRDPLAGLTSATYVDVDLGKGICDFEKALRTFRNAKILHLKTSEMIARGTWEYAWRDRNGIATCPKLTDFSIIGYWGYRSLYQDTIRISLTEIWPETLKARKSMGLKRFVLQYEGQDALEWNLAKDDWEYRCFGQRTKEWNQVDGTWELLKHRENTDLYEEFSSPANVNTDIRTLLELRRRKQDIFEDFDGHAAMRWGK